MKLACHLLKAHAQKGFLPATLPLGNELLVNPFAQSRPLPVCRAP